MNSLAQALGRIVAANSTSIHDEDVIRYGLEVFLGGFLQVLLLIAIGWYLELLPELLAVLISFSLFRRLGGGAHCSSYLRCTLAGLITFPVLAYISHVVSYGYFEVYLIIITSFSLITIYIKAPLDTETKPIKDPQDRSRLKIGAAWLVAILLIISEFIHLLGHDLIAIALLIGICYQTLTMTRLGAIYMRFWDIILSNWWVNNLGKEES
ncbi:MAG: accessory gene regulator ArgB-like protein [Deltaproteobacteria bacterium]